jgi:hypothetical protein
MGPAVLASLALWALDVEGAVTCPSPDEVAARLRPLLDGDTVGQPGDRVRLEREQGVLRVALVQADGRVRGVRNVDERHDCGELAEAAAVIVATWQPEPLAAVAEAEPEAVATTVRRQREAEAEAAAGSARREGTGFQAAVGALMGFSGGPGVPGIGLETGWGPGALAFHLRAQAGDWHHLAIGGTEDRGDVRWRRWPLALGPALRVPGQNLAFELDVSLAAAWLSLFGDGFASNQRHDALDVGASAGARLAWRGPLPVMPWVGVTGAFWPRKTVAQEVSGQARVTLPRVEVGLVAGLAFGP